MTVVLKILTSRANGPMKIIYPMQQEKQVMALQQSNHATLQQEVETLGLHLQRVREHLDNGKRELVVSEPVPLRKNRTLKQRLVAAVMEIC